MSALQKVTESNEVVVQPVKCSVCEADRPALSGGPSVSRQFENWLHSTPHCTCSAGPSQHKERAASDDTIFPNAPERPSAFQVLVSHSLS